MDCVGIVVFLKGLLCFSLEVFYFERIRVLFSWELYMNRLSCFLWEWLFFAEGIIWCFPLEVMSFERIIVRVFFQRNY